MIYNRRIRELSEKLRDIEKKLSETKDQGSVEEDEITKLTRKLQNDQVQVFNEQIKEYRNYLQDLLARWEKWALFGGAFTISGVVGLFIYVITQINGAKQNIDIAIEKSYNDKIIKDKVLAQYEKNITKNVEDNVEREMAIDAFASVSAALGQEKLFLLNLQNRPAKARRSNLQDPREIKDIIYDLDSLQEEYLPRLSQGEVPKERRNAILWVVDGFAKRAEGKMEEANLSFENAIKTDYSFPEARVYQATLLLKQITYLGGSKWSHPEKRDKIAELLQDAKWLPEAEKSSVVRQSESLLYWAKKQIPQAIAEAHQEIMRERNERVRVHPDPQIFLRLSKYYWDASTAFRSDFKKADSLREKSAYYAMQALKLDAGYLRASNNYIWATSHRNDGLDTLIRLGQMSVNVQSEFKDRVEDLESEPSAKRSPDLLNTLSEAYYILGNKQKALERGREARMQANLQNRGSIVEWLDERLMRMQKGTL